MTHLEYKWMYQNEMKKKKKNQTEMLGLKSLKSWHSWDALEKEENCHGGNSQRSMCQ